jgi:hypothetical protein
MGEKEPHATRSRGVLVESAMTLLSLLSGNVYVSISIAEDGMFWEAGAVLDCWGTSCIVMVNDGGKQNMRVGSMKELMTLERVGVLGGVRAQKKPSRRVGENFLTGGGPDRRNRSGKVKWAGLCEIFSILFVKDFIGGAKGANI